MSAAAGARNAGAPRALNCPNCGAPIVVRAAGLTVSVICGNCGSTLDATDPALKLIHQSNEALARPQIPLGSRGVLEGTEWEVVGYLERSGDGYDWHEYLLFNPWTGYRFLVDGDEWRLGRALDRLPVELGDRASFDGQSHAAQAHYDARVDFVVGEFYWRVAVGETVVATDFGEPWRGFTLSREANGSEVSWTRLDRLDAATVAAAFGVTLAGDDDDDGPAGPLPDGRPLWFSLVIAAIAFVALLIALAAKPSATLVASDTIRLDLGGPVVTRMIGPIEQARSSSAIEISATTDVDNSWVELDYALVERRTQQRFEASATAEYYTGSDADGRWSEGDPRPRTKFASIPRGTYNLIVEARAKPWGSGSFFGSSDASGPPVNVTIGIIRDASFGSSFLLAALAIFAWPAWLAWRRHAAGQRDE